MGMGMESQIVVQVKAARDDAKRQSEALLAAQLETNRLLGLLLNQLAPVSTLPPPPI